MLGTPTSQAKYLKLVKWVLYFGLCGLSAFFMWGVLDKYFSGKTGFTQIEAPIKEFPTITICFIIPKSSNSSYEYDLDFIIQYHIQYKSLDGPGFISSSRALTCRVRTIEGLRPVEVSRSRSRSRSLQVLNQPTC